MVCRQLQSHVELRGRHHLRAVFADNDVKVHLVSIYFSTNVKQVVGKLQTFFVKFLRNKKTWKKIQTH
jgi:predicted transcriptional regulator